MKRGGTAAAFFSAPFDAACRLDEGGHFHRVFSARCGLDATGDVDHPGADTGNPGRDVLGRQAAGQNQPGQGGILSRTSDGTVAPEPPDCPGT